MGQPGCGLLIVRGRPPGCWDFGGGGKPRAVANPGKKETANGVVGGVVRVFEGVPDQKKTHPRLGGI